MLIDTPEAFREQEMSNLPEAAGRLYPALIKATPYRALSNRSLISLLLQCLSHPWKSLREHYRSCNVNFADSFPRRSNPITKADLDNVLHKLGQKLKPDEEPAYLGLLQALHDSVETVLNLPGL